MQIDVQNFFPSILHDVLLKRIKGRTRYTKLISLVEAAIKTPTGNAEINSCGVPQGLSISNILSSIYMKRIDDEAQDKYVYYRYVDDILIICKKEMARDNLEAMMKGLKRLGLVD